MTCRPDLRTCALLLGLVGCGDNYRPAQLPDAAIAVDAPIFVDTLIAEVDSAPVIRDIILQVNNAGSDANNGVTAPIATLKRAIAIANADPRVAGIAFASGRYTEETGETFPYLVPADLVLAGPPTGGAILVGNKATGLTVTRGTLRDLALEDFTVAITVTGDLRAENIQVRGSAIALRGEAASSTTVSNLEITGISALCTASIVLTGAAELAVVSLATQEVSTLLDAADTSAVRITGGNLAGNRACAGAPMLRIATNGSLTLTDTALTDSEIGIEVLPPARPRLLLTNTTVHNAVHGVRGAPATFHMTGGALTHNTAEGATSDGGAWSFTDVTIKDNVIGLALQSRAMDPATTLTMRRTTITQNRTRGIKLLDYTIADLGTAASPGQNTISSNGLGIEIGGTVGGHLVNAVGNHWSPGIQEANAVGDYVDVRVIAGPVKAADTNNYAVAAGWSIQR